MMTEGIEVETPFTEVRSSTERFWVDNYDWLIGRGYQLRPRYAPRWLPSWSGTSKHFLDCEDGQEMLSSIIMDASRISDGVLVMMKKLRPSIHPNEVKIGRLFSSEPLKNSPQNHCVPLLEVLEVPDEDDLVILVMPLLKEYDKPGFDTIGETVEFFGQIFEGLNFMHAHRVAHRDCMNLNIMMDASPLYPTPYHPVDPQMKMDFTSTVQPFTRTQKPVRYYLIDFGISQQYEKGLRPLEHPIWGGDKTVPEFQNSDQPCDPFPTDVYYIGNMIRGDFLDGDEFSAGAHGFEFMTELVAEMVKRDPSARPTMEEVVCRFQGIRRSLSSRVLRSRFVKRDESTVAGILRNVSHWYRRVGSLV